MELTTSPEQAAELSWEVGSPSKLQTLGLGPIDVFVDGSGGKHSDDPRLRRCGWGVVIILMKDNDLHADIECGIFGTLAGCKQTVGRAELTACTKALAWLPKHCSINLISDNLTCVEGIKAGSLNPKLGNCDLWQEFWRLVAGRAWLVTLAKVKAHSQAAHLKSGSISIFSLFGNYLADALANAGASQNQLPEHHCLAVGQVDIVTNLLKRLIQIQKLTSTLVARPAQQAKAGALDSQLVSGRQASPSFGGTWAQASMEWQLYKALL